MSLAIAEKRPQQRPGSCVGIFFHLFSKKKLFSKKLLPPAKKAAAKKFSGDDQVPMGKLLLVAAENCNGSPKPDPQPEPDTGGRMQAAGIVARLMGLETMPVVPHEKPRKALDSKFATDGRLDRSRLDHGLCLDNADGRAESRPQKQQRTESFFEKGAAEVFHRGLVGGSRRKQQVRLGPAQPPAKSPRLLSRSNTARLVQVANRILEPGLQSRSQGKCAIMYRDPLGFDEDGVREPSTGLSIGSCSGCGSLVAAKEPAVGDFGCSALDFGNVSEERDELKSTAALSGQPKNVSEVNQTKLMPEESSNKLKSTGVLNGQRSGSLTIQAKLNPESRGRGPVERKQDDHSNKSLVRRSGFSQNSLPPSREEVASGAKVCSRRQAGRDPNDLNGSKGFLSSNKNHDHRARSRSPTKVSRSQSPEVERNGWEKNMGGKKRPINSSQIGSASVSASTYGKGKSACSDVVNRKEFIGNRSTSSSSVKNATRKVDVNNLSGSKDNGIVSFTFNSPMRHDSGSLAREGMVQRRRGQGELSRDAGQRKKLASDEKTGSLSSKGMAMGGVELSSLLEEKIRELSSLDQDDLDTGDDLPGRSTASILEELISALTMEAPEMDNNGDSSSDLSVRTDDSVSRNRIGTIDKEFQDKDQPVNITAYLSSDTNQPSPVSILEASFSNDSCSLSSPNDSSGGKSQFGLSEICKKTLSLDSETDLVDTATSSTISQSSGEKLHHSINKSSSMYEFRVSQTEASGATTAISDAELLFESISINWLDGSVESSLNLFLLEALETITDASTLNFHAKEGYQLKEFMFDCLMECLNSKFSLFWRSGLKAWMKLPLLLDREQLMGEVHAEIRGWNELAGKFLDDLVDKDMSRTNVSWTERNAETFEVGVEIQSDILKALVEETLLDLCCY
ncbi:Uncharacterized protein M6B38_236015 [Iris pallida]|uniref:DUF4378 domain-containing protein n=1 Tax=Iris pallida TaxID=29817 RepID=A0AAX6DNS3_IRIPA|nr:Uncharacterized protein M6B38_236015 [Iris pallida]